MSEKKTLEASRFVIRPWLIHPRWKGQCSLPAKQGSQESVALPDLVPEVSSAILGGTPSETESKGPCEGRLGPLGWVQSFFWTKRGLLAQGSLKGLHFATI